MDLLQARVLVVDDPHGDLSRALAPALEGQDVEVARDAVDTIYRIDCTAHPPDVIFCDVARGELPGPELWAYLSLTRPAAARRIVFVASGPLSPEAIALLGRIPNLCVDLPADADAIQSLARRRGSLRPRSYVA